MCRINRNRKRWIPCLVLAVLAAVLVLPTAEVAAEEASEVNIAVMAISVIEEPWNTALLQSIERIKQRKPHGLTVNYEVVAESVIPPDAERVLRDVAKTGKYQIIWAHSSYSDAVRTLSKRFPDIAWVCGGSGNEPIGGNAYWFNNFCSEAGYLLGVIAGKMTKTDVIGVVGAYPYPVINGPVNAYIKGAKDANPDVKVKVTYIESWYDPPKAKETALAQIAAGADIIYADRFGPFEACKEKGVYAFGQYVDQHDMAPSVVISSTINKWDPAVHMVIDEWWWHTKHGVPYHSPKKEIHFNMREDGCDIAPFHGLADEIPQEVKNAVAKAKAEIMAGVLEVPLNLAPAKSD